MRKIAFSILWILVVAMGNAQKIKPIKAVLSAGKVVALTFDDGLEPEIHKKMLTILKKEAVPVTFFMIGSKLSNKKLIKRALQEGHEIGNHSMTHPVLPKLSMEGIKKEIIGFQEKFKREFDYSPKLFRAPKLQYDDRVMEVLVAQKLIPINATVGTKDYLEITSVDDIVFAATESPKLGDGAIVLMHEKQKTLEALPRIIAFYKAKGYKFLTVSALLNLK
ncbi:polysaccharide deacetylase family protein [Flavicella sediminum]|uniref:polysaccharide deacetylase family protein n=1 Tax=Flavicella sediminum TaxID=2585141 RepID=UPI0014084BD3|nr:polysaccharide deacetylase family protein [Flavicella sediminum]